MNLLAKEVAKLGVNALQDAYVAVARTTRAIDFPVPPNSSLRKTSSKTVRHYYESGIRCYLPIATMALHYGVRLDEKINVLDFGCGVARQLLHFTRRYPAPNYIACDIDATSVDFVTHHFPQVKAYCSQFTPPLQYEAGTMDMIYSVSIFSHLTPEDHLPWLTELFRITRPGGLCFLTTEGFTALRMMEAVFPGSRAAEDLRSEGILYKEYSFLKQDLSRTIRIPIASTTMGIEGSYGNTVLSPHHIRATWPKSGFEVLDVIDGIIDHRQDLVVLRRPA